MNPSQDQSCDVMCGNFGGWCNDEDFKMTRDEIIKMAPHIHYFMSKKSAYFIDGVAQPACNVRLTYALHDIENKCPYYKSPTALLMDDETLMDVYPGPVASDNNDDQTIWWKSDGTNSCGSKGNNYQMAYAVCPCNYFPNPPTAAIPDKSKAKKIVNMLEGGHLTERMIKKLENKLDKVEG